VAGKLADGVWTLGDPRRAPSVIQAYRRGAEQAGREPGEIVLQGVFSWAPDDDEALEQCREWKGTMVDEAYTEPISDPAEIRRLGEEKVPDAEFKAEVIISSDPDTHAKRIKSLQAMGATSMALMNVSGRHGVEALKVYGEHVLPQLRD
jgi:coenzyme F420-dependent glucose-6-phosphate dehydrogenase